jgi:hypothetical protein
MKDEDEKGKKEYVTGSGICLNVSVSVAHILCASRNVALSFLVLKFIFFVIIINNMINLTIILKISV